MIRIEQLSVSYQDSLAVDNISLNIDGPSITGILGPNGAGKSTLIKAMLGIIDHEGQAYLDDRPLSQQLGRIAYVEQKADIDFNFPIKVRECVSLGLYPKISFFRRMSRSDWDRVSQALELVGLSDYGERQISQLSGGQFQRVLIARCLVQEADYIFLDEPFVGIDSVSEDIIMATLRRLRDQGKTILIVHHDLSKVPDYFDQILLLKGQLVAFGPTETAFNQENLQTAYGAQIFIKGGL